MEAMGLTGFDAAILAVILVSGVMAFARGLIREVFSIVAFIGGALAALYFRHLLVPYLKGVFPGQSILADISAAFLMFLVVFIIITILTSFLAKAIHRSAEIGTLDRLLGLAFGVLRGVLIGALVLLLMRHITDPPEVAPQASAPAWIANARLCGPLESIAIGIEAVIPEARQAYSEARSGQDVDVSGRTKAAADAARGAVAETYRLCRRPGTGPLVPSSPTPPAAGG
jgi:membrane protein required for colicin V production